uniref:Uncharacterized protein n=1 Tax=Anopheles coluzzii TaxID=1518534 RepID=A0A8W7PGF8_ANOCL
MQPGADLYHARHARHHILAVRTGHSSRQSDHVRAGRYAQYLPALTIEQRNFARRFLLDRGGPSEEKEEDEEDDDSDRESDARSFRLSSSKQYGSTSTFHEPDRGPGAANRSQGLHFGLVCKSLEKQVCALGEKRPIVSRSLVIYRKILTPAYRDALYLKASVMNAPARPGSDIDHPTETGAREQ